MLRINLCICTFIFAIVLTITNTILGQQSSFFRKPWPTYSLQNMPQTRFTCHDKILGGYYADPEAQCQMFHVCVKVAGVGVQDFRFLCPNGTAFDQEAQICADWGDVDCEQSVLYYGSDNFDLYRLGSGFESKRAPLAEEDESTFHLQRAESGDVRRFKETRVDQKSRPDQPPNYTKHFETVTRGTFNGNANKNNNNNNNNNNFVNTQQNVKTKKQKQQQTEVTKKPIVSYYTPTSTTTTRTTTTTTTERNYNDDSKQDLDDIFKGSHSSHFFSNRNGGREDDFLDHPVKPSQKPNDFSDFNKKSEASTIGKSRVTPTRPKRPLQTSTTTISSTTTTTAAPKAAKKVTQHSYYNTDLYDYSQYKSTTSASHSTTLVTTPRPVQAHSNANRFNVGFSDYQTQAKIQPTTYNPNRYKPTTTKYIEFKRDKSETPSHNKPSGNNKKTQKFEQTQQKLNSQNSTFVKLNEFNEFAKIKPQPPQPFQPQPPAKTFEAPAKTSAEPQYYRSRGNARANNQQPEPFRAPQRQISKPTEKVKETPTVAVKYEVKPRGFVSRGRINYKATTQRDSETYPTTASNSHKKFSTLVPKDKYAPTTFKPSTYKKSYDSNIYQSQQTVRPASQPQKSQTTSTSTTIYTTPNPYYNPNEDDGQYHPELYEIDYSRSNFNRQRQTSSPTTTTSTSTTTQKSVKLNYHNPVNHLKSQQQTSYLKEQSAAAADFSDEDELFKTAQSLNFGAASINKLRADIFKAEKTSQQFNSQYNPHNSITSPKTTTPSTPLTTTTTYFTYPSYSTSTQTTSRPTTFIVPSTTTTTTTTTTRRPTTTSTTKYTTAYPYNITKSGKHATDKSEKKSKKHENKNKKKTSKRPAHADEDTSYDYAYYDSDTLSESPQEYPEYEIQEFTKTKRN